MTQRDDAKRLFLAIGASTASLFAAAYLVHRVTLWFNAKYDDVFEWPWFSFPVLMVCFAIGGAGIIGLPIWITTRRDR